jgi:hypothetical protein
MLDEDMDSKQLEEDLKQTEQLNEKLKVQRANNEKLLPLLMKQWNSTLIDVGKANDRKLYTYIEISDEYDVYTGIHHYIYGENDRILCNVCFVRYF